MKKAFIAVAALLIAAATIIADEFSSLWYDGNAEISTYSINEMRYGELRKGIRVMVFVTEPMRLETHIKPDSRLPAREKISVVKLNDIRRFTTGIYDYNVMTSAFVAIEKKDGIPLYGTMKIAFTEQDWCGTVFEQTLRKNGHFENSIYSYFETEGTQTNALPHDRTAETEESLWITVRELRGRVLEAGASKTVRLIPSAWSRRKAHSEIRVVDGVLRKGNEQKTKTALGTRKAFPISWTIDGETTEVLVEKSYPHRILSWKEPDGSTGEILVSRREPYWKQHGNKHEYLRRNILPDS